MDVTVEETGGLERRMKVAVPEERIEGEVNDRVQTMAKTVNMPGFRPGKVPVKVVKQRYGRRIRDEVVGEIVRTSFQDALSKEQLRPASSPTIDQLHADPGDGLTYEAIFEVYPEVALPVIDDLAVERPSAEVGEDDVSKMIETLRKQRRAWQEADKEVVHGDRAIIDFSGTCEGQPIRDGKAEKVPVEIGAGRLVSGLEEGLLGARAGADLTVAVKFPDNAPDKAIAGKDAEFSVHVHSVQAPELPELDETFIKSFGVAEGTPEAFRAEIRSNLERELQDALRATTKTRVLDALLAAQAVELPNGMVNEEAERMVNQRKAELSYQGVDPEALTFDRERFEPEARRRVALGLLLGEIVKQNGLKADAERVRARIETIASTYEESERVVNWYYGSPERLNEIESAVLEDQVVEWLLERAKVSERLTTFDELLNPGQTNQEADE